MVWTVCVYLFSVLMLVFILDAPVKTLLGIFLLGAPVGDFLCMTQQ